MGCDIHMFAEKKIKSSWKVYTSEGEINNEKEFWSQIDGEFRNKYFDPIRPLGKYNLPYSDEPYEGRNYTLFAFLADVRNYHDIKPLAKPKGIPEDVSSGIKEEIEKWGGEGHSHSYFTLEELEKVDWDKTYVKQEGLVDPENYKIFKKTGRPHEWCQGTTNEEAKKVSWYISLSDFCDDFCHEALGNLRSIAYREKIPTDKIRIVFFFDN